VETELLQRAIKLLLIGRPQAKLSGKLNQNAENHSLNQGQSS